MKRAETARPRHSPPTEPPGALPSADRPSLSTVWNQVCQDLEDQFGQQLGRYRASFEALANAKVRPLGGGLCLVIDDEDLMILLKPFLDSLLNAWAKHGEAHYGPLPPTSPGRFRHLEAARRRAALESIAGDARTAETFADVRKIAQLDTEGSIAVETEPSSEYHPPKGGGDLGKSEEEALLALELEYGVSGSLTDEFRRHVKRIGRRLASRVLPSAPLPQSSPEEPSLETGSKRPEWKNAKLSGSALAHLELWWGEDIRSGRVLLREMSAENIKLVRAVYRYCRDSGIPPDRLLPPARPNAFTRRLKAKLAKA